MQNFLELSQVLWESGTSGARNRKLEGQHLWPFNIDLPKDIAFTPKRAKELNVSAVERLPPHLTGKGWTSSIYEPLNERAFLTLSKDFLLRYTDTTN